MAQTPDPKGASATGPTGDGAPIPEGQRHTRLLSLAGAMRRRGAGEETILVALISFNVARCSPPLEDHEVEAMARSMKRYPERPAKANPGARTSSHRHPVIIVRRTL